MTTLVPKYDQGATGAANRPFNLKLEESISVKDFGAVGDGSADDTVAIQAAIDSLSGAGVVHFPKGTYKVSATIDLVDVPRISLVGDGVSVSKIQAASSFTGTILIDAQHTTSIYGAVNTIAGLYLGGATGVTTGIKQRYVSNSSLENLYIQGFSSYGCYAEDSWVNVWQTIKFQSCGTGFYLNGANHNSSYNNVAVSNSTVSGGYVGGSAKVDGNSAVVFNSLLIDSANATSDSLLIIDTGADQFLTKFNDCYIGEYADGAQSIIEMISGTAIFENGIIFADSGYLATLTAGLLEIAELELRLNSIAYLYTGTTGQIKLSNVHTTMANSSAAFSLAGDTLQPNNLVRSLVAAPYGKNWTASTYTGAFTITNGNVGKTITCTTAGFAFMSTSLSSAYRFGSNVQIVVVYSSNVALEMYLSQGAGGVTPAKVIGQKDLPATAGVTSTFIDTGLLSGTLDQLYTTLEFRANAGNPYAIGDTFTIYEVYFADVSTSPRLLTLAKE